MTISKSKNMPNRNPVKQVFITFPKSHVDKNEFRDSFLIFKPSFYKVVEEKHKDGTPHLHAIVKFTNPYSCPHLLKHYKSYYPEHWKRIDIKPVRSITHALEYLSKEDTCPLTTGEYKDARGQNIEYSRRRKQWITTGRAFWKDTTVNPVEEEKLFLRNMSIQCTMPFQSLEQYYDYTNPFSPTFIP
ncbi:MAG: Rep catalytic domain protein [Circoviridae sp.]|nr:MAG: Rep catalytic domain protein [Circoviridae sp.]